MGRERLSKRSFAKQLGRIRNQLDRIEHHLFRSRIAADKSLEAASEPTEPEPGYEGPRSVLDQIGQRMDEHMKAWGQERDRFESRLRAVERAMLQPAPSRRAPVDYTPVLTAAIQLMRDVGVGLLERSRTQEQKPPSKGT